MLEDFANSDEIAFASLSDVPISELTQSLHDDRLDNRNETLTISTEEAGEVINADSSTVPYLLDLEPFAKEKQIQRELDKNDVLFIAVAWIVLLALCYFKLCPEVIWCNITSFPNNKGLHLLTFSCPISVDNQFVFLWLWIPNE